jgi:hypothetical protein
VLAFLASSSPDEVAPFLPIYLKVRWGQVIITSECRVGAALPYGRS